MELIAALSDLCNNTAQPIIAIDGPAGAGKTKLASNLEMALSLTTPTQVIHLDDLYNGWELALSDQLTKTLQHICASHQLAKKIEVSFYDWQGQAFLQAQTLPTSTILILEGVGACQSGIREYITTSIWMDIAPEKGLERVLRRDGTTIAQQMKRWLEQQEQHFRHEQSKNAADFILTT